MMVADVLELHPRRVAPTYGHHHYPDLARSAVSLLIERTGLSDMALAAAVGVRCRAAWVDEFMVAQWRGGEVVPTVDQLFALWALVDEVDFGGTLMRLGVAGA